MYKAIKTKLYLKSNEIKFLLLLMRAAKNLYNEAIYHVRQHFFETNQYLSYEDNYKIISQTSENYRILSSTQGQAIIRKVDEAMKAFFGSLKSSYKKKVKLPRYLDKNGYYSLIDRMVYKPNSEYYILPRGNFIKKISKYYEETNDQLCKYDLNIELFDSLNIRIETPKCITNKTIKEITIKPKYDGKYIEVIHTYLEEIKQVNGIVLKTETMAIDFGYNNLAMCALSNRNHLLIDGLKLKSMNQNYHKKLSKLASLRPSQMLLTRRMIQTMEKRNHQMEYGINKAAKLIVEHAKINHVKEIIIGYNEGFKDINLSKVFNQWSKSIPIARLRDRIIYLAKQSDIITAVINEAYTSKASYIDQDEIKKDTYSGERIKRGLYKSFHNILINADLNAALNILRKGKPDALWIGSRGWNTPKRTYLF
jgi:putative transposase